MEAVKTQCENAEEKIDRPVVSFCIATFQRYEIVKELIEEILSVRTDKIEVVVCDDKSRDGSVEKLRKIEDSRLKIYVNKENVGSSLNIHDSLDRGNGTYLFYVNDRDNVDPFKIEKLIEILEELEKEGVAFARCCVSGKNAEKYHIFNGEEALLQFACKMEHPTGFIFQKKVWEKVKNKRYFFENQDYGDYPITQICAIMAKKYKGAWIYGDICDICRRRIDFSRVRSGYYIKRKDKRLWYTPEVRFKEIRIGQKFLKKIGVKKSIRERILVERYTQYLPMCLTAYKDVIADPSNTEHYDFCPCQSAFYVFLVSILNGIKLWKKTVFLCKNINGQLIPQINDISKTEYMFYFKNVLEDIFTPTRGTAESGKKDYEIGKREAVLNIYENWVDAFIKKKTISEYLLKNGYCQVAIYGMGRLGRHLWKEFRNSDVRVKFVIDKKLSRRKKYYEDVPCLGMDAELPHVDMVIVTVPGEAKEIMSELRKKGDWPIKLVNDILFVLD